MGKIKAGIIGSGAMGSGIAQVAAASGCTVVLYDTNRKALTKAKEGIDASLQKLIIKGRISESEKKEISDNIYLAESAAAFSNCSIIIEAIVEDAAVKKNVFSQMEEIADDKCILATNTSSLSVTSIAAACRLPERFLGIHFFNPAPLMPLVEIIGGTMTSPAVLDEAEAIIMKWGKTTVRAKDTPGFIVNRVARSFYGESIRIYEEQIAGFEEIDEAMKSVGGFKMGPFELMDLIGNDINYTVTETVWKQMFFDERYKPSQTQKRMVEAGLLGRKTNRGYYDYNGLGTAAVEKGNADHQYIFNRVIAMLINEAADALYYGIASRDDIDLAMMKGVNYPKGLLKWCDDMGAANVLKSLEDLYSQYNEPRYRPSVLLRKMAAGNRKFY